MKTKAEIAAEIIGRANVEIGHCVERIDPVGTRIIKDPASILNISGGTFKYAGLIKAWKETVALIKDDASLERLIDFASKSARSPYYGSSTCPFANAASLAQGAAWSDVLDYLQRIAEREAEAAKKACQKAAA